MILALFQRSTAQAYFHLETQFKASNVDKLLLRKFCILTFLIALPVFDQIVIKHHDHTWKNPFIALPRVLVYVMAL